MLLFLSVLVIKICGVVFLANIASTATHWTVIDFEDILNSTIYAHVFET
jgi:hypothetical protein